MWNMRTDISLLTSLLQERNRGFFASFFLALRAHERKKLGGIFQLSNFSAYLWIISFPLRDRSSMLRPLR